MKRTNRPRLISRAILLTAVVAALFSCGDDDGDSERRARFTLIEKDIWGLTEYLTESDCSEETGRANTAAFQQAINTLTGEGETNLRLEKGKYCLWGGSSVEYSGAVTVPSNVEFDLGGSTLQLTANDERHTTILRIENAENIKIFNGELIGDRISHNYGNLTGIRADFNQSKEWAYHSGGSGIRIRGGQNIELYDLTIREVTGDCITMIDFRSSNVTIRDNKLSRARRDGIVGANVDNLVIRDNHIFDIYNDVVHIDETGKIISIGAEACIAFEADSRYESHVIENVLIHNNILDGRVPESQSKYPNGADRYDLSALNTHVGTRGVIIRKNRIFGDWELRYGSNILFEDNDVRGGKRGIEASGAVNPDLWRLNSANVIIRNNDFYDYRVRIFAGNLYSGHPGWRQNYAVAGNRFKDGSGITIMSNVVTAIIDNEFAVQDGQSSIRGVWFEVNAPPHDGVDYKFYWAGNKATPAGSTLSRLYSLVFENAPASFSVYGNDGPGQYLERLPDWYRESNDRDEAVAWIDSWKWF